jgi:hypothetical protein
MPMARAWTPIATPTGSWLTAPDGVQSRKKEDVAYDDLDGESAE